MGLDVETSQGSLERLRGEVAELRASRERLVLAGDADRRRIERALHDGVQQQLIALAVNLQLARPIADADTAAGALLDELGRDVQRALDEAAQLAERIYPPLLEAGGIAAALRSAAVRAGSSASVEVTADGNYPPEVARTVYLCCLEAFDGAGALQKVAVRDSDGALVFELVTATTPTASNAWVDRQRDRVEALGGTLTTRSEPGGGTRVSGSLPLSR